MISLLEDKRGLVKLTFVNFIQVFVEYLYNMCGSVILNFSTFNNILYIRVKLEHFYNFIVFLKKYTFTQFSLFIDLCIIDFPNKVNRFEFRYIFLSMLYNIRCVISFESKELQVIPSLTSLFNSAIWLEREAWDMFGVYFKDHPDLRKLLTDYGFEGYPLRKDFPLNGFVEIRYDFNRKQVIYESLQLSQTLRIFTFNNPWKLYNLV